MNSVRHSKKQLKEALNTSYDELSEEVERILKNPTPLILFNLAKRATGAMAWTSNALFTYLASQTKVGKKRHSEVFNAEDRDLLKKIAEGDEIDFNEYPLPRLFRLVHKELVYSHLNRRHKSLLTCPKIKPTLVLVPGVLNEIFNTASFERGTKTLKRKHGFNYFVPRVHGTKGVKINARLIEEQLKEYIKTHPKEKLWLVAHSKGGLDSLHFLSHNRDFAEKYIVGLSTIATPILGSAHTEHLFLKALRLLHKVPKKFSKDVDIIAEDAQISLSKKYREGWFKRHYQDLPKNIFYSAVALEAEWYESHVWMILTKIFFQTDKPNDGIVLVEQARFPDYFPAYNFGVIKGHHLIGARSSTYIQEAMIEAHFILLTYLKAL